MFESIAEIGTIGALSQWFAQLLDYQDTLGNSKNKSKNSDYYLKKLMIYLNMLSWM